VGAATGVALVAGEGSPRIRTVTATRYVTPLREGGSLPAIIEADDDGLYVLKFHGAGQGRRALIAELVAGEIARVLGLLVPEIVLVELDTALGRSEPDYEIRSLINASGGLNLALDYLPGSTAFTPALRPLPGSDIASAIVWFDALIMNVDRTARNTNMLMWHRALYVIDHGASLYFHHTWTDYMERSRVVFPQIVEHVLLPYAARLREADGVFAPVLTEDVLEGVVELIPDVWLTDVSQFVTPADHRAAYLAYLVNRLEGPRLWVEHAMEAHARVV